MTEAKAMTQAGMTPLGGGGGPGAAAALVPVRVIRSRSGDRQLADLLQMVFGAEFILPSRCLWLVSAWVTDVPVLDNRTGAFSSVEPRWPRAQVRLSRVLLALAERGTTVHVATRPDMVNS